MKFGFEGINNIKDLARVIAIAFQNITLSNFKGIEKTITFKAKEEVSIGNSLQKEIKRYIILDQTGNGLITRSSKKVKSKDVFYLVNNGDETVTATILFME